MANTPIDMTQSTEAAEAILKRIAEVAPECGPEMLHHLADAFAAVMGAARTNEARTPSRIR